MQVPGCPKAEVLAASGKVAAFGIAEVASEDLDKVEVLAIWWLCTQEPQKRSRRDSASIFTCCPKGAVLWQLLSGIEQLIPDERSDLQDS